MKEGELGRVYSDGEVIFKEGETGDVMYVIQAGKVKITKKTSSGEIAIATLGSGEMALFDKMTRSATAAALGDARVLSVDKKKLFATLSRDPTLAFKLLETMSQRIRGLNERLMSFGKDRVGILKLCKDVDETCDLILEDMRNIIHADNGSIMLIDDDGKTLSIKSAFGIKSDQRMKLSVGKGIAGDVLRTGRTELLNNVSLDPRFVQGEARISSMLCVPLRCGERNLGVINMSNSSERLFNVDDLKLLHSIALYASVAIENARNFSNFDSAAEELLRNATVKEYC